MDMTHLTPTQIGDISEAHLKARFIEKGYLVFEPYNNGLRHDFVAYDIAADRYLRIQVKTGHIKNGVVMFSASSQDPANRSKRVDYRGDIDYFAVYCYDNQKCYWLHVNDAPLHNCNLRIEPTKNGQRKGIRWANDYEF